MGQEKKALNDLRKEEFEQRCIFKDTNINPVISKLFHSVATAMTPRGGRKIQELPQNHDNEERNI